MSGWPSTKAVKGRRRTAHPHLGYFWPHRLRDTRKRRRLDEDAQTYIREGARLAEQSRCSGGEKRRLHVNHSGCPRDVLPDYQIQYSFTFSLNYSVWVYPFTNWQDSAVLSNCRFRTRDPPFHFTLNCPPYRCTILRVRGDNRTRTEYLREKVNRVSRFTNGQDSAVVRRTVKSKIEWRVPGSKSTG